MFESRHFDLFEDKFLDKITVKALFYLKTYFCFYIKMIKILLIPCINSCFMETLAIDKVVANMRIPKHIAIIPDGNRRWAVQHKLEKKDGYQKGLDPGVQVLRKAKEYGISEITYYGFTTDNCKRLTEQKEAFKKACVDALRLIKEEGNVSLLVLGNAESENFPKELIQYTTRQEIGNPEIKVNFLVNYGWDWDLSGIAHRKDAYSKEISRIDLVIRWGNMRRLSGMLPIQSVYADFYVVEDLWPDFDERDFDAAISWYDKQDITLGG